MFSHSPHFHADRFPAQLRALGLSLRISWCAAMCWQVSGTGHHRRARSCWGDANKCIYGMLSLPCFVHCAVCRAGSHLPHLKQPLQIEPPPWGDITHLLTLLDMGIWHIQICQTLHTDCEEPPPLAPSAFARSLSLAASLCLTSRRFCI